MASPSLSELQGQQRQLETLDRLAQRFGQSLSSALAGSNVSGKALNQTLASLGSSLAGSALTSGLAALKSTLAGSVAGALQSYSGAMLAQRFGGAMPFATGGVLSQGQVTPFAGGGIVSAPTYFPMQGGLGLMGERGAEAVMPLARGPDGRLGVQGGQARPVSVTLHVSTPDAESFRRSQAQVSAALARAVARGGRAS